MTSSTGEKGDFERIFKRANEEAEDAGLADLADGFDGLSEPLSDISDQDDDRNEPRTKVTNRV